MADASITLTVTHTTRPVRYPGQEGVPFEQLRREPFVAVRTSIEVGAGHETEVGAIIEALHQVQRIPEMELDIYVKRETRSEYGQLISEGQAEKYGTLTGGDQGQLVRIGESVTSPDKDDDAHPLHGNFTPGRRPSRGQRHVRRQAGRR